MSPNQTPDPCRAEFEAGYFGNAPQGVKARERSGDGYLCMGPQAAWTTWQLAWKAATAHQASVPQYTAPLAAAEPAAPFQPRVQPWLLACFGEMIAGDREERNHRFLEEALELVQACGCSASEAHQLVDYVYGRPVGEPPQEVGGVMVTLAALCLANGLDMHDAAEVELARIWTKVEAIRAKQAAKPKHSPLPGVATSAPAAAPAGLAPTEQQAHDLGAKGAPATDAERMLFEAWMRGHCWALCATWDGKGYRSDAEQGGNLDPRAAATRRLWAAWRDRAALAAPALSHPTGVDPEHGPMLDAATAGELAFYDYAVQQHCAATLEILDSKDTGAGANTEPWATVRKRLLALAQAAASVLGGARPMDLAPRDGTHILAWLPDSETWYVVCWADASMGIRKELRGARPGWHLAWDGYRFDTPAPDYWQPLPARPDRPAVGMADAKGPTDGR